MPSSGRGESRNTRKPAPHGKGNKGKGALVTGGSKSLSSLSSISETFMPIFPAKVKKTLRYQEYINVTSTSGTLNGYVFSANGLYDPNITGTGHQPMGFDQMMAFYEHYFVEACRIKVNFTNTAASTMVAGIRMDAATTLAGNIQQMIEFGGLTFDCLEAKNTYGSSKTMKLAVDVCKIQGVRRGNLTAAEELRGDSANNPTEQTYFHIMAWDPNSNTGTITCDVVMEFDAVFVEPRFLTQSLYKAEPKVESKTAPPPDKSFCVI